MSPSIDPFEFLNRVDQLYYRALWAMFIAGLTGLLLSILTATVQGALRWAGARLKKCNESGRYTGLLEKLNTGLFGS